MTNQPLNMLWRTWSQLQGATNRRIRDGQVTAAEDGHSGRYVAPASFYQTFNIADETQARALEASEQQLDLPKLV